MTEKKNAEPVKRQKPNLHLGSKALADYQSRMAQVLLNHKIVVPHVMSMERDGITSYYCGECTKQIKQDGDKWIHE